MLQHASDTPYVSSHCLCNLLLCGHADWKGVIGVLMKDSSLDSCAILHGFDGYAMAPLRAEEAPACMVRT